MTEKTKLEWKYFTEIPLKRYIFTKASIILTLIGLFLILFEMVITNLTMSNVISRTGLLYMILGLIGLIYCCLMFLQFEVEVPNK